MIDPNDAPDTGRPREDGRASRGVDAAAAADAAMLEDIDALRSRAAAAEEERSQLLGLLQRTRADFENYQKRSQRDLAQERRYWHGSLALDLLPVLDNFERAAAAARQAGETGSLAQGVTMIMAQFLDVLRRHGITPIEAQGQPFDPNIHQAVMQQPSAEQPPNTVLQVLEQGYRIHDRVLRPAKVIVSVPAE